MDQPTRPLGIRVSPDGTAVAMHYITDPEPKWTAFAFSEEGAMLRAAVLDPAEVEGWIEWSPVEPGGG
jgi:hypothetical protein